MADGGILENYGLLAMMQRGVKRAVVFINTNTVLDPDIEPDQAPKPGQIDVSFPPLFGYEHRSLGRALQNNTVFSPAEYAAVVSQLRAAHRTGRPLIAVQEHQVLRNDWWGIAGGWRMQIMWVYLGRVPQWEAQLDASVQEAIKNGNRKIKTGPCQHFPNYKTAAENGLHITEQTPYQARLMSDLTCWIITSQADRLARFIRGE